MKHRTFARRKYSRCWMLHADWMQDNMLTTEHAWSPYWKPMLYWKEQVEIQTLGLIIQCAINTRKVMSDRKVEAIRNEFLTESNAVSMETSTGMGLGDREP